MALDDQSLRTYPLNNVSLTSRYFRIAFHYGSARDNANLNVEGQGSEVEHVPLLLPNARPIYINSTDIHSSKPVGRCIDCGATVSVLGNEHIVAKGLGGNLVLDAASCKSCEALTSLTELKLLRNIWGATRAQLKIIGKKRKSARSDTYELVTYINEQQTIIRVPVDIHPTIMFLCALAPPRRLEPRLLEASNIAGMFARALTTIVPDAPVTAIASCSFDSLGFAQLLCKIAIGYAFFFGAAGTHRTRAIRFCPVKTNKHRSTTNDF